MVTKSQTTQYRFIKKFQKSPPLFFRDMLGVSTLEKYQIEKILKPIVKYDRVAISACHSVGKTWSLARIVIWFLILFKNAKVITTAPTNRQVRKLLWGELHSAVANAKFPMGGKLLQTEWNIGPEWFAMGFSPQKEAGNSSSEQTGSSFQGWHSKFILIVFDEAVGISTDVWKMAEGLTTSGEIVKWVCIANPTTRSCEFFNCFNNPTTDWHLEYINCFDSPNLQINGFKNLRDIKNELEHLSALENDEAIKHIQEYKKPVPHLMSAQWCIASARKWGVDHPLFQSKALGQFPDVDENVIVQLADVETAIGREQEIGRWDDRFIGVDVARYGEDSTVITEMYNTKQTLKKDIVKRSVTEVVQEVVHTIERDHTRKTRVLIDATGIGAGVFDILNDKYRKVSHVQIVEVHFGQGCESYDGEKDDENDKDKKRYTNLKAKMFDLLGKDIKNKLDLMDYEEYLIELPTIQYSYQSNEKMKIESKDDYKKRTGKSSPDSSDSLALANLARYYKPKFGSFSGMNKNKEAQKPTRQDIKKRVQKRIKPTGY